MKKKTVYEFTEQQLNDIISKHIAENDSIVDFDIIDMQFFNNTKLEDVMFTRIEVTVIQKEVKKNRRITTAIHK